MRRGGQESTRKVQMCPLDDRASQKISSQIILEAQQYLQSTMLLGHRWMRILLLGVEHISRPELFYYTQVLTHFQVNIVRRTVFVNAHVTFFHHPVKCESTYCLQCC
jgi:hypothetical protein